LLLDLSKKTWENQRKIRSTSLTHINSAAEKQLGLVGLIQRVANPEDKRERLYRISPEYIRSIPALLRNL
jgi:DNA-binding MarR family transcriptional regulator